MVVRNFLIGWRGLGRNEDERQSTTSMFCVYINYLFADGVEFDPDSCFWKAIDPKTGKFTDNDFKFSQELGRYWKQCAAANGLDAGLYSGLFFFYLFYELVFCF